MEIQVEPTNELCDRIQCYTAKMVSDKVKAGDDYNGMAQSIGIVILDYQL